MIMAQSLVNGIFALAGVYKNSETDQWVFAEETTVPETTSDEELPVEASKHSAVQDLSMLESLKILDSPSESVEPGKSKRKKNKKKKGDSKLKEKSAEKSTKKLSWGNVIQIFFHREIGFSSVPSSGSHPLGLGLEESREECTIDELFARQQFDLIRRATESGIQIKVEQSYRDLYEEKKPTEPKKQTKRNSKTEDLSLGAIATKEYMSPIVETRQLDHKAGMRNLIFRPLSESERIEKLMSNINLQTSNSLKESEHNLLNKINKDIRTIKDSREETGCNCKAIKIDKMSVVKMKTELGNHSNLLSCHPCDVDKMSKSELVGKVKEVMRQCHLCTDNHCECVQLGLPCSSQTCGCLRGGYHPDHQTQSCGNLNGIEVFDPSKVDQHRKMFITQENSQNNTSSNQVDVVGYRRARSATA